MLAALTLQQPPPGGLNYGTEDLLAFLGAVGAERTVDEFLPAVVYALGVPGANAEEARRAGIRFLRRQARATGETRRWLADNGGTLSDTLEAAVNIGMGSSDYREADTYKRPDWEKAPSPEHQECCDCSACVTTRREQTRNNPPPLSLGEELNTAISLPEWMKTYSLTDDEWAKAAQISHPALHYLAMKSASEAVLCDAALCARTAMLILGWGPAPRGETLLTLWGLVTAALLSDPRMHEWFRYLNPFLTHHRLPEALELLRGKSFGKAMETGGFDAVGIVVTNELWPLD